MERTRNALAKTGGFCFTLFGIGLISLTNFGECKVGLLQTTPQAVVTVPPKLCSFNDINYRVGENWNPFLLPKGYYRCIRCSCKLSRDSSMAIVDCKGCRKPTANGHHPEDGQKSCTHEGKTRKHGTVWAVDVRNSHSLRDNQCTECSCTDGFVTCAIRACPVLSCKHQLNGTKTCCPVCKGDLQRPRDPMGCKTMGRYYGHNETWSPRIPPRFDMCVSCFCKNTSVECRNPDCPKITCDKPERKPGACCDSCPVSHSPGECEWGKRKFPHNSTFHPTIGPFGVSYCVKCVCNASKIKCERLQCPANYSCPNPVSVPGKCCKVCGEGESEGTDEPVTPTGSNGRRHCNSGKYWRVFEYRKINGRQPQNNTYIWVQFALEDKERDIVEIHTIAANTTHKTVKVTTTSKRNFDRVKLRNYQYIYIGKIREVQRVKMKDNEKRRCHLTQGCVHTVLKIIERLRARVGRCNPGSSSPPDTLRMLENQGS